MAEERTNGNCVVRMNEQRLVSSSMKKFGGSFVRRLGEALSYADPGNAARIKTAFHDHWKKYLRFARLENKLMFVKMKADDYWKSAWSAATDREREATERYLRYRGEIDSLRMELDSMKAQRNRWRKESGRLKNHLNNAEELSHLWRLHLNEAPIEDDDDWEAEARQILCNKSDIGKRRVVEGKKE